MTIRVEEFSAADTERWDDCVARSLAGTFLHTRRFLSYHEHRFQDQSVCIYDSERLVGVVPAAVDPAEPGYVSSHPGATYGGIVHDGALRGSAMIEALDALCRHYRGLGMTRLRYKAVPHIYHCAPAEDDLYALFRRGARRYRCDLAAVINLEHRLPVSSRRRRCLKSASTEGVTVVEVQGIPCSFWALLERTLMLRHQARPAHTLEEIRLLQSRFPDRIRLIVALTGEELLGGVVTFTTPTVVHVQYSCGSTRGHSLHAMDAVYEHCIGAAARAGARWFSMGISNEDEGRILNDGLYRFKTEFGAGGVAHEFYELQLS